MNTYRGANTKRAAEVADILEDRIVSGEYKPGEYLPHTRELASEFRVTTNTLGLVRGILKARGLVTMVRGSGGTQTGTMVLKPNSQEGILDREIRLQREYQEILERMKSLHDNDGETILGYVIILIEARMKGIGS